MALELQLHPSDSERSVPLCMVSRAAASVFQQLYQLSVQPEEFIPFGGMGEDRFLAGVAQKYSVQGYDAQAAKQLFFDTYLSMVQDPNMSIAYPGEFTQQAGCGCCHRLQHISKA